MEMWQLIDWRSGEIKAKTSAEEAAEIFRNRPDDWEHVVIVKGDENIRTFHFGCDRYGEYCSLRKNLTVKKNASKSAIQQATESLSIWALILKSRQVSSIRKYPGPLKDAIGPELAKSVDFMILMTMKEGCEFFSPITQPMWPRAYKEAHKLVGIYGLPYKVVFQRRLGVIVVCPETQRVVPGFEFRMATSQEQTSKITCRA